MLSKEIQVVKSKFCFW